MSSNSQTPRASQTKPRPRSRRWVRITLTASFLATYYVMSIGYPYAERTYNANTDWSQVTNAGPEPWDGTLLGMCLWTIGGWAAAGILYRFTIVTAKIAPKPDATLPSYLLALVVVAVPVLVALFFGWK